MPDDWIRVGRILGKHPCGYAIDPPPTHEEKFLLQNCSNKTVILVVGVFFAILAFGSVLKQKGNI